MYLNEGCTRRANYYDASATKWLKILYNSVPNIAATLETENKVPSDLMVQTTVNPGNPGNPEVDAVVPLVACMDLPHRKTDVKITDQVVPKQTALHRH